MLGLEGTPYALEKNIEEKIASKLREIEDRVRLLRNSGTLTHDTLKQYYGSTRFQQVAESNAIEGSTLSVGETEFAVMKGITITGHDPAYVRDAIALDKALTRVTEIAKNKGPTTLDEINEIHALLLGDRPGAGIFRNERVSIRGSDHRPPRTYPEICAQMENLENWSRANGELPAPVRSIVLHAWFTHIHPYIDGNGRTARALSNLELIRQGYPPVIIKKTTDRDRYISALSSSDQAGDLSSLFDLYFEKIDGSLTGLEASARRNQGYDEIAERLKALREKHLSIWLTSIELLGKIIESKLTPSLEKVGGSCRLRIFYDTISVDDYVSLCEGKSVSGGWAFIASIIIPGFPRIDRLAYIGHRSGQMYNEMGRVGGPSLYWSRPNPDGFPKWISDGHLSPYAAEITLEAGNGDSWTVRLGTGKITQCSTTDLADQISTALLKSATS
jgi:Fic family protein